MQYFKMRLQTARWRPRKMKVTVIFYFLSKTSVTRNCCSPTVCWHCFFSSPFLLLVTSEAEIDDAADCFTVRSRERGAGVAAVGGLSAGSHWGVRELWTGRELVWSQSPSLLDIFRPPSSHCRWSRTINLIAVTSESHCFRFSFLFFILRPGAESLIPVLLMMQLMRIQATENFRLNQAYFQFQSCYRCVMLRDNVKEFLKRNCMI